MFTLFKRKKQEIKDEMIPLVWQEYFLYIENIKRKLPGLSKELMPFFEASKKLDRTNLKISKEEKKNADAVEITFNITDLLGLVVVLRIKSIQGKIRNAKIIYDSRYYNWKNRYIGKQISIRFLNPDICILEHSTQYSTSFDFASSGFFKDKKVIRYKKYTRISEETYRNGELIERWYNLDGNKCYEYIDSFGNIRNSKEYSRHSFDKKYQNALALTKEK